MPVVHFPETVGRPRSDNPSALGGLYRNVWRYASGVRTQLVGAMSLLVFSQVVKLAAPWLTAQAINALQSNRPGAATSAAAYVVAVLATFAVSWALHGPGRVLERTVALRVRQGYADALYAKLMRLPLAWHDRHHSGEVQQRVGQSADALYGFTGSQYVYLQAAVNLVGPLVALVLLSTPLGAVAALGYVVVGLVVLRFDGALMRLAVTENAAERKYRTGLLDFLGNISTLFALRLQQDTGRLLSARLAAIFVPLRKTVVLQEWKWCSVDLLGLLLSWGLVATFVVLSGHTGQAILIGSVFMVHQYAQQAGGVIGSLAANFQGFARTRIDFSSAELVWNAPDLPAAGVALPRDWGRIQVTGLCYDHPVASESPRQDAHARPSAAEPAPAGLYDVDLTLARGDRIALVGPSGSGKSTLMRVLAGLYVPKAVVLAVDGVTRPDTRHLGSLSTLVPQEADVFEATVRENITFGRQTDDQAVLAAIHTSAFDAVIADMPLGLETPITERGFNLSGGQRQRLCLSRGVLAASSSSLVMLDEPTSALDPVTEEAVFSRLVASFANDCVVASVHRMSLLPHFNRVVLMVAGRVVDTGSVAELSARQPLFRAMLPTPGVSVSNPSLPGQGGVLCDALAARERQVKKC